jgi:hypothetical protein
MWQLWARWMKKPIQLSILVKLGAARLVLSFINQGKESGTPACL